MANDKRTISIYDNSFEVPQPYSEGHTLSAIEAGVLNQCFAENISNNQRKHVKAAMDEAEGAPTLEEVIAGFKEYASNYQFTEAGTSSRIQLTPVEKEAKKIATALVNKHLRETDRKKADVDPDLYAAQVAKVAASDTVLKAAKRRVKEMEAFDDFEIPADGEVEATGEAA